MASTAISCDHHDHHHGAHHHHAVPDTRPAERATTIVLGLTIVTMAAELLAGWWTGSMALLADGWHMAMHAAAMGVAVIAYRFARRHAQSGRFAFGAGKAGDLGGFANAVLLAVMAVLVIGESVSRLVRPEPIVFGTAMAVAAIGLGVNLASAWLLREQPCDHGCGHDNNREAALVHVVSDALTSVLAIVALFCGQQFGLVWLDPLIGLVGAVVILRWAVALAQRSGAVLLDAVPDAAMGSAVRTIAAAHGDDVQALRIWPIAAGRYAAALTVTTRAGPDYRAELLQVPGIDHVIVESRPAMAAHACSHGHAH